MTTASTSSVVDHTSDAGFRAWASEFSTQIAAVGLVQTADTGQINLATVTRPAINTSGGYQIWRFADSTIYLKVEYGTFSSAAVPQMWITVGTGSNGSGTITGQTSTRAIFTSGGTITSTATNYTSRWCHVADAFAVSWKEGSASSGNVNGGFLTVGKTVDGTGAATTTGFGVLRHAGSGSSTALSLQSVRTAATAASGTDTTQCGFIPGAVTSSLVGANTQAYSLWLNTPDVTPFNWANIVINAEEPRGTSFSVAMVGTGAHTYCSTGQLFTQGINGYTAATYGIGYIFE